MTGAVTFEQLAWIIGIIVAAGSAVAIFLGWVYFLVQKLKHDAEIKIDATLARVMQLEAEHNDYRVHVAEKFATKDGVTQAISRMEAAVEKLTTLVHDSVERLTNRLDRILETRDIRGGQ